MGNYRFRFSWFYTSNNKITKTQPITTSSSSSSVSSFPLSSQPAIDHRKSYYFTRDLTDPTRIHSPQLETNRPDPKRKPTKKKKPISPKIQLRRKLKSPELNPAAVCGCRTTPESSLTSPEQSVYEKVDLPPIITKPGKQNEFGSGKENEFGSGKWVIDGGNRSLSVRVVKEGIIGSPVGKVKGNSYSPRLGNRVKVNGINGGRRRTGNRRSLSESLAVVKTSVDPGRDFKESMVEMIMENNIKSSKDLEDLLACYLALNSDEYHDLIIKVFKQIWFESSDIRL